MNAATDLLVRLYKPADAIPAANLRDLGEGLQAQLEGLALYPTPARCEAVAANLDGARRAVLRLRAKVMEVHDE